MGKKKQTKNLIQWVDKRRIKEIADFKRFYMKLPSNQLAS